MQYLSPRTDITFKRVFGNEHHKKITISFLNSLLDLKEGKLIKEIAFRDTANVRETINQKDSFVDIHCIDQASNHFIIEMQVAPQAYFLQRSIYYSSLVFSRQLATAVNYEKLVPVILIAVVDHILFKDHNNVITNYVFTDSKTGKAMSQSYLELHFVELPKFKKTVDELETDADEWIYFMKDAENLKAIPAKMQHSQAFQEAFHVLDKMRWTDDEFEAYIAQLDTAGREDRIEQAGRERGQQEGALKKSEAFAIKLLKKGMSLSEISDLAELSIEQIAELSKNIKK